MIVYNANLGTVCIFIYIYFFVSSTMARGVNTIIMLVNTSSYPHNMNYETLKRQRKPKRYLIQTFGTKTRHNVKVVQKKIEIVIT